MTVPLRLPPSTTPTTQKGSVTLTATKTIKVADGFDHTTKPADGEFTFDLKDAAGNVLDTAKNDANGKVSFTREFQLSDLDGAREQGLHLHHRGAAGRGAGHGL